MPRALLAMMLAAAAAACGAGTPTQVVPAATAPTTTSAAAATDASITITVPPEVPAGSTFNAAWTGTETAGDFLVIVPAGATTWTETPDSPYYNATLGNPAPLVAPKAAGAYEVWFLKGNTDGPIIIKARAPFTVK